MTPPRAKYAGRKSADTVRFVDDEEGHRNRLQQLQKRFVFELFGRRIGDLHFAGAYALARPHFLFFRKRRVERDDVGDTPLAQHVELIFHQRDQRAYDDCRTFEQQGRQLIR
jgi:hypothetical protein